MKKIIISLVLCLMLSPVLVAAGTYSVDKNHTSVNFTAKYMGVVKVPGKFKVFDGSIKGDFSDISNLELFAEVEINSIDTDNEARDKHLRNEDFFHVEKHAKAYFRSKSVSKLSEGSYQLTGTLEIKDVTKTITIPLTVSKPVKNKDGKSVIGLESIFIINRFDYGISYGPRMMIGEDVEVVINVTLVEN